MKAKRTIFVFLAGCGAYASMAACSGGSDTATGSTTHGTAAGGGEQGGGGPAGGHGGSVAGGPGGGGAHAGGGATGGGGAGGGTGGAGGGGNGHRLKRYFGAGADGSVNLSIGFSPWSDFVGGSSVYAKPIHLWWDSQRDEDCVFKPAADGKIRCLPVDDPTAYAAYWLIGGVCTHVVTRQHVASCPHHPRYYLPTEEPMCPITVGATPLRVFEVGAKIGMDQCFFSDATCTQFGCSSGQLDVYELGAEVDLGEFVAATKTMDP